MKELIELFFIFSKIGVMTFGGGYAMLPMLEKELIGNKKWVTQEELIDYFAIGQCTPGVIAVNTATFIGYKQKGIWGAVFATIGVIFPSFVIVATIAAFLQNFSSLSLIQHAFAAIRVAVGVLIFNAVFKLWKTTVKNKLGIFLALTAFLVSVIFSPSPILIVITGALTGLLIPVLKGDGNNA